MTRLPAESASQRVATVALFARPVWWISVASLAAAVVLGAVNCYCDQFSQFDACDDEGLLMMSVRFMLDGHRIYRDCGLPYGPAWCFSRWLIFGLCGVPLWHDYVRLLSCFFRCATSLCLGLAVFRLPVVGWKRTWLAMACFSSAILHLRLFVPGPGHPQEIIVAALAAAFLVAAFLGKARPATVAGLLGVIAATLVFVKINVGIFFCCGCALALLSLSPQSIYWNALRQVVVVGALTLLLWFLRQEWDLPWAVFCACVATGLACCLATIRAFPGPRIFTVREWLWFAAGGMIVASALVAFSVAVLGSPLEMFNSLVLLPSRTFGGGKGSLSIELPILPATALACQLAGTVVACFTLSSGAYSRFFQRQVIPWVKLAVAAFIFCVLAGDHTFAVSCTPAFAWLAILAPASREPGPGELLFRRLVCLVTILELMQAFPVAGASQILAGCLGAILIGVICLIDWAEGMRGLFARRGPAIASFGVAAIGLLTFAQLAIATRTNADRFQRSVPVDFAGCRLTRLPLQRAVLYRWLVDNVQNADTFVGKVGYHSLNFWSGRKPVTRKLVGWSWRTVPEPVQRELIDVYRRAGDVLVIDFFGAIDYYRWDDTTFGRFVVSNFRPVARWGDFTLWRKTEFLNKPITGCASIDWPPVAGRPNATGAGAAMTELHLPASGTPLPQPPARAMIVECRTTMTFADTKAENPLRRIDMAERPGSPSREAGAPTCAVTTWLCANLPDGSFPGLFFFDGVSKTPMLQVPVVLRTVQRR